MNQDGSAAITNNGHALPLWVLLLTLCCLAFASVLLDTKNKIQKMKDYQDKLMETLGYVLEKHFPPPGQANASKRMKVKMSANDALQTYFPF